ncbi:hypothetical protein L0156_04445 [bacterium]|nr:hypothetical protein [bacterium]
MVRREVIRLSKNAQDYLFLALVITLSFILYIGGLGFYSDDWAFFGASYSSPDRSLLGLYESLNGPVVWMRPVQVFYFAALYKAFDLHPFGYHFVNHLVFLAGIFSFYGVLSQLSQPRLVCVSVPLLFGLIPHYSTDRFWPILFCANLSMASYFLSFCCDLQMLKVSGLRIWLWKLLGILFLFAGTLAYEVFLPLFLLSTFLIWKRNQQLNESNQGITGRKLVCLVGTNFIALLLVILFKAFTTTRVIMQGPMDHVIWFIQLIAKAVVVSYGKYGIELPLLISRILRDYPDWKILAVSLCVGIAVFLYLHRLAIRSGSSELRRYGNLFFIGLLVFILGYLIFITNENADPTPAGLNNRTSIAATVGVALSIVGIIGWLAGKIRSENFRLLLFCSFLAFFCGAGVLVTNTIAHFWIVAYSKQENVLADIRRQYPSLPPQSTLLLDGVCPYMGPGIVFESNWDLAGALRLFYQDHSLNADIIRPTVRITEEGVQTILYGATATHPYNKLYIYHYRRKVSQQLTNAEDARRYFQTYNPYYGIECPDAKEGVGVPIF